MQIYKTKQPRLTGTSYNELERKARKIHNEIARRTKRNPYVRSAYFKKNKVFIGLFWQHLNQKSRRDRKRRLQLYSCAIELIRHSSCDPIVKPNPNGKNEIVYRFNGISKDGVLFCVQIKEDLRSDNKYFMSVFATKRKVPQV